MCVPVCVCVGRGMGSWGHNVANNAESTHYCEAKIDHTTPYLAAASVSFTHGRLGESKPGDLNGYFSESSRKSLC